MSDATTYADGLKVFTDDEEWVIAKDVADVFEVFKETGAGQVVSNFAECQPDRPFTFSGDDGPVTKTYAQWAKERGRGWFAGIF